MLCSVIGKMFNPEQQQHHRTASHHGVGIVDTGTVKGSLGITKHVNEPGTEKNTGSEGLTQPEGWALTI